jgi:hypothetical protein
MSLRYYLDLPFGLGPPFKAFDLDVEPRLKLRG